MFEKNFYDEMWITFYPFLVQTASMVVEKAKSLKSKYQFRVEQDKVIEVPFSGEAKNVSFKFRKK